MTGRLFLWVFLLAALPSPALALWDFLSTLGVRTFWDMDRTKSEFTRAGIPQPADSGSGEPGGPG